MRMKTVTALLLILSAAGWARGLDGFRAERDSNLPPNVKWYLEQRENKDRFLRFGSSCGLPGMPDSQGVRMVGKWGRAAANKVTGRDSLVFMSLGSEVAVFNVADGSNPRIVSEIQCRSMTGRLCLRDSYLFVGSQGPVEVYSVANPMQPRFISFGPVIAPDISLQDTLVYALGSDSLYIFDAADPANWQLLGATRDSGYSLNVADGFAYLADRWGLYIVDCTDPTNPHWASTLSGGVETRASCAEGGYCYYTETYPNTAFVVANVADPYHPVESGRTASMGGYDIHKRDFYVYLSSYEILDVSIPSSPAVISSIVIEGNGVWTRGPYDHSFVGADYGGLASVNITDPVNPRVDTEVAGASASYDVHVDNGLAYVANFLSGVKILDLASISNPRQVGSYDTIGWRPYSYAVTARDSFAYLVNQVPDGFRVINVSSPDNPRLEGWCRITDLGRAAVLRETLVYVAEDYHFEIFSIANPRNPRLMGSCGLPNASGDLWLVDTLAYVA
jgi:hypothetical protein